MRGFGRLSILFNMLVVGLVLAIFGGVMASWYYDRAGQNSEEVVFEVPQGAGLNNVTQSLEERGLIDSAMFFKMAAYFNGVQDQIKFGEYKIPKNASMRDIQDILTEGRAIQLMVTFPEGWTSYKIVERLNNTEGLTGEITDIPAEGSLAPNTYAYMRGDNRQKIIDQMVKAQQANLEMAWENRDEDLPIKDQEELLILASIIEKETAVPEERPLVSSVFVNRLRKGMRLQTDPTVIYGITLGKSELGRGLYRSELDEATPYNTYVINGLPPTPIANPGLKALQAAANPSDTDFIYFVAKSGNVSDGHNFSRTLEEHNANVAAYRSSLE